MRNRTIKPQIAAIRIIALILSLMLAGVFAGCLKTSRKYKRDPSKSIDGLFYIGYSDIDSVCDVPELLEEGKQFLKSQKDNMFLSFVVDAAISMEAAELRPYDHLVFANRKWIRSFGDTTKLMPIEFDSLSSEMQRFFEGQVSIWTNDRSALAPGMSLYEYRGGSLMALPNFAAQGEKPIFAKNPLIVLIDNPVAALQASAFLLPLTSSGNILFISKGVLTNYFDDSVLKNYGRVKEIGNASN